MCRRYGSGMVAFSYGAFASNFLSRGVMLASDATSSVDCMQPPASNPKHRKIRARAAIIWSSLALLVPRPGNGVVITQESYSFQNLTAAACMWLRPVAGMPHRNGPKRVDLLATVWRQLVNDCLPFRLKPIA